ncbi:MAG: phosphoglycerate dehydrogenase [Helicobacteraceae bacterium]|jgi:D-3-phosphoglycerate dehydrogenase|nr:phosphoglycerate dehydrogenase [Helicobacteraceae bacterium]
MKKRVIVCDHIHDKGVDILKSAKDIDLDVAYDAPKEKLYSRLADAELAITRSSTPVDIKFLDAAHKLKYVIRAGVGVDNVDIEECSRRGVAVMNVPTANTVAAVEMTMCHLVCSARSFVYAHSELKEKRVWKRENWYGTELLGKSLGVIGFGNIGAKVAVRAQAFGMEIVAFDPYIQPSKVTSLGMTYTTNFDDILACDIITIHTPKNKETTNVIAAKEIAKMKNGVILINVARGGLYNESDLAVALKSGKVRFAGLDVFSKEPATDNPLLDLPNVSVTPHLGANTIESQINIAVQSAENALEVLRGISYPNALNLPIKEGSMPAWASGYCELTQRMAFLAAQTLKSSIRSVGVSASGEAANYLESFGVFATVGALNKSIAEKVNYVNAPFVAKERGLEVSTRKDEGESPYKNLVTVRASDDSESVYISGILFGNESPRIVNINGFDMDVVPKGKMILFKNSDVPGVIGKVGALLGNAKINIADFRLGRDKFGKAMALIIIDNEATQPVLDALAALPEAIRVSYAEL